MTAGDDDGDDYEDEPGDGRESPKARHDSKARDFLHRTPPVDGRRSDQGDVPRSKVDGVVETAVEMTSVANQFVPVSLERTANEPQLTSDDDRPS